MGGSITELPDGMEIKGGCSLIGAEVDSCDDHRIAMSMAIAALIAKGQTVISHAEAVAISYPSFIPTLQKIYGDDQI
jgi:3-phosphoshikimate 1-carboxyvinyltransferase